MIILVEFGSSGDDFVTKADLKMVGGGVVLKGCGVGKDMHLRQCTFGRRS